MKKIAIFASGSGSNAENIAHYFKNSTEISIDIILANNPKAYVLERAKKLNIPAVTFTREEFNNGSVLNILTENKIDYIILAGFLWLIPGEIISTYHNKIINIHPALLPNYGGKGMYGMKVHESVIANKEKESGISIHFVNEHYDEGAIIFQAKCNITPDDTADTLAQKIHELEYEYFPKIIEDTLLKSE